MGEVAWGRSLTSRTALVSLQTERVLTPEPGADFRDSAGSSHSPLCRQARKKVKEAAAHKKRRAGSKTTAGADAGTKAAHTAPPAVAEDDVQRPAGVTTPADEIVPTSPPPPPPPRLGGGIAARGPRRFRRCSLLARAAVRLQAEALNLMEASRPTRRATTALIRCKCPARTSGGHQSRVSRSSGGYVSPPHPHCGIRRRSTRQRGRMTTTSTSRLGRDGRETALLLQRSRSAPPAATATAAAAAAAAARRGRRPRKWRGSAKTPLHGEVPVTALNQAYCGACRTARKKAIASGAPRLRRKYAGGAGAGGATGRASTAAPSTAATATGGAAGPAASQPEIICLLSSDDDE